MYKAKHFIIQELVDQETFESTPEWKLWLGLDQRILKIIDLLREDPVIGVPITINNWKWGGDRNWSGLRNPSSPWYSKWSQHSFGRAVDMKFKGIHATEVRKRIKDLFNSGAFSHITDSITVEVSIGGKEISWVHLDVRSSEPGYNELRL